MSLRIEVEDFTLSYLWVLDVPKNVTTSGGFLKTAVALHLILGIFNSLLQFRDSVPLIGGGF